MAKDFARTSNKKNKAAVNKSSPNNQPAVSVWLYVITGIAIASFVILLVVLSKTSTKDAEPIQLPTLKQTEQTKAPNKFDQKPLPKQPEMEWEYPKRLKEKTIEIPETEVVEKRPPMEYILQCASFKSYDAAETLKAKIAFVGLQAKIDSSVSSTTGTTWYRVKLGPYPTKRGAERKRHFLQNKRIEGCAIYGRRLENH